MHPDFLQAVLKDHERELARRARIARPRPAERPVVSTEAVVLRLCCVHDDSELGRLAQLESRPAPTGRFVVAEVGGTIVAALPLGCGRALADPFRPTAHLLPLLELRAKQLSREGTPRGAFGLLGIVRSWVRA